jgi:tRNA dimethylallyltransferase
MSNYLISIVGPTAIGKTRLSIALARHFDTEIISADSRQFFKEMQIGTAAPTAEELEAAPHHFIHHKSITDSYNVGAFEKEAMASLEQLFKNHDTVIMVGGSGLYVDAVTKGLDEFPKVDPEIRNSLNAKLKAEGLEALQLQLKNADPKSYATMAVDNPQRVIRALEVCISSGTPYSNFLTSENKQRSFKTISIGLTAERVKIYERIEARVDLMMAAGLLDEVETLLPQKHLNALQTVGYKELFNYLEGEWDLEFAISEIKKNSRRFAKRQLTWFKRDASTLWFDDETPQHQIIDAIESEIF